MRKRVLRLHADQFEQKATRHLSHIYQREILINDKNKHKLTDFFRVLFTSPHGHRNRSVCFGHNHELADFDLQSKVPEHIKVRQVSIAE